MSLGVRDKGPFEKLFNAMPFATINFLIETADSIWRSVCFHIFLFLNSNKSRGARRKKEKKKTSPVFGTQSVLFKESSAFNLFLPL